MPTGHHHAAWLTAGRRRQEIFHEGIGMNDNIHDHARKIFGPIIRSLLASIALFILSVHPWTPKAMAFESISKELRRTIETLQLSPTSIVHCEVIHSGSKLMDFYREHDFKPFWVSSHGTNDLGSRLPSQLLHSQLHGLNPDDYHHQCIQNILDSLVEQKDLGLSPNANLLAELDILMTDAFMSYAFHLASGKVNPVKIYPQWAADRNNSDIKSILDALMIHRDLDRSIRELAPPHQEYWALIVAGKEMEEIVARGGWPQVPQGPTLRQGDTDQRVPLLRKRLIASRDLKKDSSPTKKNVYNEELHAAVKKFQEKHGLEVDGIVGPQTYGALNTSAEERHRQILLNLERWRWLPREWDDRYVLVNTAAFHLDAWKNHEKALSMRVIVGKDAQRTPVFSGQMTYLEINPYWHVPRSIAVNEYLPKLKANPGFAAANGFQLLQGSGRDYQEIDPRTVDWSTVTPRNFRWFMRQSPGPKNALGRIKFIFPNHFHVYLHDTPQRHLFQRNHRAFSHGCIRIEKPLELAELLLADDPSWTRERIDTIVNSGRRRVVMLPEPWTVHIYYWTAWVDEYGETQFRKDLYEKDGDLWAALKS